MDLLANCQTMNENGAAQDIVESPGMDTSALLTSAYRAVGAAVEVARNVENDPDWYGLDEVSGSQVSVLLRRAARDLEHEADEWGRA